MGLLFHMTDLLYLAKNGVDRSDTVVCLVIVDFMMVAKKFSICIKGTKGMAAFDLAHAP